MGEGAISGLSDRLEDVWSLMISSGITEIATGLLCLRQVAREDYKRSDAQLERRCQGLVGQRLDVQVLDAASLAVNNLITEVGECWLVDSLAYPDANGHALP